MKITDIFESSTTAGAIATGTPSRIGKMQKRAGNLLKGKVTCKPFYEAEVNEEEIVEQDLILVPGQLKGKDKSFIPHDKDRRDHEVEMARSDLYAAAKNAMRIFQALKDRSEDEGLMGWQQSYITLAADYLNSVADNVEYDAKVAEMTGGVLAGGMSNFEEGYKDGHGGYKKFSGDGPPEKQPLLGKDGSRRKKHMRDMVELLQTMDLSTPITPELYSVIIKKLDRLKEEGVAEDDAGDVEKRMVAKIEKEKQRLAKLKQTDPEAYKREMAKRKTSGKVPPVSTFEDQGVAEGKCPECGGPAFSEESIAEAKDACYHKVKSRYKVWPSAYASGALVKCRKVGAANWGNKSKK